MHRFSDFVQCPPVAATQYAHCGRWSPFADAECSWRVGKMRASAKTSVHVAACHWRRFLFVLVAVTMLEFITGTSYEARIKVWVVSPGLSPTCDV